MLELTLFLFFCANTSYVLLLAVSGHFYKKKPILTTNVLKKIAVFVPSYKEDNVIIHTTEELLKLDYPKDLFDIIIVADSLREDTLLKLRNTSAIIIPVSLEKSMKCRSLNYAFNHVDQNYDIAIIADADNILSKTFLKDINYLFNQRNIIIQAQRVAKNLNTSMAFLDGLSEAINNHLFRQGSNAIGLSSALIGSGMAFPFLLIKEELSKIDSAVEDKALQIALVEKGYNILYQKGTVVYDEKVDTAEAYKNQRRRWIAGQYDVLKRNFLKGFKLLFQGNVNFFNIAVCQNIFPSRINSIIILFILSLVFSIVYLGNYEIIIRWWSLTTIFLCALALAIPKKYYTLRLAKAIFFMPIVILRTIQATFQARNANKSFIHTEHKQSKIDTNIPL